jgi:signal transduction histidine kinase
MAHDLKAPLVTLDHLVDDLGSGDDAARSRGGAAEHTRRVVHHMQGLVAQILEFAKDADGSKLEGETRVADTVGEVVGLLQPEWGPKRVRLDVEGPQEARLRMSPEALRHVLLNLIDNAVKYGHEETPHVRVAWHHEASGPPAGRFVLEVADNGEGLAPEHRERVFALFARVPDRRGRDLPGTGVGLALVRRIVKRQGGYVEVADAPEGGALFRVVFPPECVIKAPVTPVRDPVEVLEAGPKRGLDKSPVAQ